MLPNASASAASAFATITVNETSTSATYGDLATPGPSVTVTTGTKALVAIGGLITTSVGGELVLASYAVSGATTVAASDSRAVGGYVSGINAPQFHAGNTFVVTGLTAGSNVFTMKYRRTGGTASFNQRTISVVDLGS